MEELDGFTARAWRGDESIPVYECHGCHSGIMGITEARAHQCVTPIVRVPVIRPSVIVNDRGEPFMVTEPPEPETAGESGTVETETETEPGGRRSRRNRDDDC